MEKDVKNVSESTEAEGAEEVAQESEESTEESTEETAEQAEVRKAGDKTDANLLLESLRTERELRRKEQEEKKVLERQLLELQNPDGSYSEEGLRLKGEIDSLRQELSRTHEEKAFEGVKSQYPAIADKLDEFNEFKKDYVGVPLEKIAKLFVVENDLMPIKERKGLERGNTGVKSAPSSKLTQEEIKDMRENNFRKYQKLVREGKV